MIFVTVGTHEQPFNRLIKHIDLLIENKVITEKVFMQIGYSDYIPKNCEYKKFVTYDCMEEMIDNSRIVITHGGPSSFLSVLSKKKTPIVVPRYSKFNEHINNHQIEFAKKY
ncbi:glycosyltransferase [Enterococcus casseliflavus]|uniref:glycosyltransferase n=1 Tax=Enterococcus casseliflavus TaxID=37734 RepID=UPI001F456F04|nr:glycosyltransferase [Enterococcus casseliflavus]